MGKLLLSVTLISYLLLHIGIRSEAQQKHQSPRSPVIKLDVPNPTADKPQSKIWFMEGYWWALLPKSNGPSLWKRTGQGWAEVTQVNEALRGNPGRVDVWSDGKEVMAVGVGKNHLMVYHLTKNEESWDCSISGILSPPSLLAHGIETATIVRDGTGSWWVAADADEKVYVWTSADGSTWSKANEVAKGLHEDDISTLTALPGGIGLIWSDQNQDAVKFRFHSDNKQEWDTVELVDEGNRTADDHLRSSVSADGSLWVATKNSLDQVGKPQLVLRIRSADGKWKNLPFADLGQIKKPSRPAVFTTEGGGPVLIGYTEYNGINSNRGVIKFAITDTSDNKVLKQLKTVLKPKFKAGKNGFRINDITGPKASFPKGAPWIILASDQHGHIYEVDLGKSIKSPLNSKTVDGFNE